MRYCKPSTVGEAGLPLAAAFALRPGEDHLSVNRLEYFGARDPDSAVDQVRSAFQAKGFRLRPNGRFVTLNSGAAKAAIEAALNESVAGTARVEHLPVKGDESHGGLFGYAVDDFAVQVELSLLVDEESVSLAVLEAGSY